jgi:hypothetical protein
MEYDAYYAEIAALLAFLVMGVRLHRMGVRTRSAPERLLSAAFLLWALGYLLWDVPYAFSQDESEIWVFVFASRVAIDLGTIALALFIRSVFRARERWARWLVVASAFGVLAGVAGSAWSGDWLGDRPFDSAWYWMELAGNLAPSAWMAAEGLIAHRNARRRERLGLCDPLTCNRFLLWGIAGAIWLLLEFVVLAQEIQLRLAGRSFALGDAFSGLCQFVPVVLVWLAFFPPVSYREWISRRATRVDRPSTAR